MDAPMPGEVEREPSNILAKFAATAPSDDHGQRTANTELGEADRREHALLR
jgi:hypothetical protein